MELWSREDVTADIDVVEHRRSYAGHTIYRVVLKVFTAGDIPVKLNEVFVWRRYNELKKLHKELKALVVQSEETSVSFPEFIKAKIFGRFDEHIIEERQISAAQFLKFVAKKSHLCKSAVLKKFFEGAIKCNEQTSRTGPSDEPLYLNEWDQRLSLSGSITDESREADSAEEQYEPGTTSQTRGVWNNRQPTPDALESDNRGDLMSRADESAIENEASTNVADPLGDSTVHGALAGGEDGCERPDGLQQDSIVGIPNNRCVSNGPDEVPESGTPGGDCIAASALDDVADDDVFSTSDAGNEEEGKWLREAFSVCSEGDDIERLASEADELKDISSLNVSQLNDECQDEMKEETSILESSARPEVEGDSDDDLVDALCSLPKLPDDVVDDDLSPDRNEDSVECEADDELPQQYAESIVETTTKPSSSEAELKISEETELSPMNKVVRSCPSKEIRGDDSSREIANEDGESSKNTNERVDGFSSDRTAQDDDQGTSSAKDNPDNLQEEGGEMQQSLDLNMPSRHEQPTKNRFSLSLDDKTKAQIQRAIEADDYVYQASLAMSEAIEREEQKQYQASFELYKLGIGLLLQGVQQDSDEGRRVAVRRKTAQYLLRAENVYRNYLHEANGERNTRKSAINLADVKTLGVVDKIFLVERHMSGEVFGVKVLHKCGAEYKNKREFVAKGNRKLIDSKYMVKLRHFTETSTGIYLFLEFISGGLLWNYLDMDLGWNSDFPACCDVNANRSRADVKAACNGKSNQSTDAVTVVEKSHKTNEDVIRVWMAEIVSVLSDLHEHGIICKDLNPRNVLLDSDGHIKLTYFSNIRGVEYCINENALERSYAAPEANGIFPLTRAADWWSLGAIFFELLTRKSLHSCYPTGIHSHSIINLPKPLSNEAWALLAGLIRYNPKDRLGSGVAGCEEIKSHPFFASINWKEI